MLAFLRYIINNLFFYYRKIPSPTTNLKAKIKEVKMAIAQVEIDWEVSKSDDVQGQELTVMTEKEGEEVKELLSVELGPNVDKYILDIEEKTTVYVKIVAYDGTYYSKPMINSFYVPDLTEPMPPVSEGWRIISIDNKPVY
jgi:hypothetical protein